MATALESLKRLRFASIELLVDGFQFQKRDVQHYVLTHFHSDHTVGLSKGFDKGTIYCTNETASMVVQHTGVAEDRVRGLSLGETLEINGVEITFLDAGHCPGSAVVMFDEPETRRLVLHTGDLRASADVREGIARWLAGRTVNELYLDTTYCSPRWSFPDQKVVCTWMEDIAAQEQQREPETLFIVGSYQIGKEKAARAVAEAVNSSVFVDHRRWQTIKFAGWGDMKLKSGLPLWSIDKTDCRVWMVPLGGLGHDVLLHSLESSKGKFRSVVAFRPTGWSFSRAMERQGASGIKAWMENDGRTRVFAVPYSEHSSFTELRDLVAMLKPERVIPTVNAETRAARERVMAPLLGLLDLRNDRERMDYYLTAESNDDLDGLVDVLAASAVDKGASSGGSSSSCYSKNGSTELSSHASDVLMVISDDDSDIEVGKCSLSTETKIDIDVGGDGGAKSHKQTPTPLQCMGARSHPASSSSGRADADSELRNVSLAQQRRLLQYYETMQTKMHEAKGGKLKSGKLKPWVSKKMRAKMKEERAKAASNEAKGSSIMTMLGVKQASSSNKAASKKVQSKQRKRSANSAGGASRKKPTEQGDSAAQGAQEKRPSRFVPKPSARVLERIDRAFTHRLYVLGHEELEDGQTGAWVDVLGSTGNVYRVTLSSKGNDCQCPDFSKGHTVCKHILFVTLRVCKLDREDHRVWQTSLTPSELRPLLAQLRDGTRLGTVRADPAIMRGYQEISSQDAERTHAAPQPLPADCPICYEEICQACFQKDSAMESSTAVTCRTCGHHLHADCRNRWAKSSPKGDTCPLCRNPWEAPTLDGGVMNLAAFSSEQQPSLQELYPETHRWITPGRSPRLTL